MKNICPNELVVFVDAIPTGWYVFGYHHPHQVGLIILHGLLLHQSCTKSSIIKMVVIAGGPSVVSRRIGTVIDCGTKGIRNRRLGKCKAV